MAPDPHSHIQPALTDPAFRDWLPARRPTRAAALLVCFYLLLIVYASLHPFSGWRFGGVSPLAFLESGWPRYWTVFDPVVNVLVYVPLGFFLMVALSRRAGTLGAILLAMLCGGLLSFGIEVVQNWLPSRVASNLDLVCNSLGAVIGSLLGWRYGLRFFPRLWHWHRQWFLDLPEVEWSLPVLALWLLLSLSPEIMLFGAGDLRQWLGVLPPPETGALLPPVSADSFQITETFVVLSNSVALGLWVSCVVNGYWLPFVAPLVFLLLALCVRTLGAMILLGQAEAFSWLTPGAENGLALGILLLATMLTLPMHIRLLLAMAALMVGTVLANLAPLDPYSLAALKVWQQGHFLNFNGLTRLLAAVWPVLALPYLFLLGRRFFRG
jgi:VanZ family protein